VYKVKRFLEAVGIIAVALSAFALTFAVALGPTIVVLWIVIHFARKYW
jgi:hypothetical protein